MASHTKAKHAKEVKAERPEKPENTEKPEPKPDPTVHFVNARYPSQVVQVPGRLLRDGIKFENGRYKTADPKEIATLDDNEHAQREDS